MYKLSDDEISAFIENMVGLSHVSRFHGHAVIKDQSVADHSSRVAMLAYLLALEYYKNETDAYRVATYGLFHDFSEGILKNDANSSIKRKYGIREILKKLETEVVTDMFPGNSTASISLQGLLLEKCSSMDYKLFKMADTLDFGLFVWHEIMLGNNHIRPLLDSFRSEFTNHDAEICSLSLAYKTANMILSVEE